MKEKVLLIYGGKSVEHDISIITALQVEKSVPKQFDVLLCYIDRDGKWWIGENLNDIKIYKNFQKFGKNLHQVTLVLGENVLLLRKNQKYTKHSHILTVLNCCHGNLGEDGSVQGVFEVCGIGQTSAGVLSSALCMDKSLMKDVCKANDIKTPEYIYFGKEDFDRNKVCKKIKFPLIVKPSNLGSSIGITVCKDESELDDAVELAFEFDQKVLVEKLVENLREFNCACLMYKNEIIISHVNEVTNKGEIYSFEDKYLSTSGKGQEADKVLTRKIKALTEKVYRLFDCQGIVRVDFLVDEKTGDVFVNEINSIPGSLAFYLFKDVSFNDLLNATISQSINNLKEKEKLIRTFESDALKTFEEVAEKVTKK